MTSIFIKPQKSIIFYEIQRTTSNKGVPGEISKSKTDIDRLVHQTTLRAY